jgi:enoyl-CoA hydratase/carnithine racemase
VSRVVPADRLEGASNELALTIASMSATAVYAIKECVNRSSESSLTEGVLFERRAFHAAFATDDQKTHGRVCREAAGRVRPPLNRPPAPLARVRSLSRQASAGSRSTRAGCP